MKWTNSHYYSVKRFRHILDRIGKHLYGYKLQNARDKCEKEGVDKDDYFFKSQDFIKIDRQQQTDYCVYYLFKVR